MSKLVAIGITGATAAVAFAAWCFGGTEPAMVTTHELPHCVPEDGHAPTAVAEIVRRDGHSTEQADEEVAAPLREPAPVVLLDAAQPEDRAPTRMLLIRVLDAATDRDLRDVQVVAMPKNASGRSADWGPVLVEHRMSPLSFAPSGNGWCCYAVRTPKHAWNGFRAEAEDRRIHEVRLEPGGDVEVAFTGALPPEGAVVRVRKPDIGPRELPFEDEAAVPARGSVLIDGLLAKQLVFTVEKGGTGDEPIIVGRAEHTVIAGVRSHVTIHLDYVAEPPRVRAAGRLTISPAWTAQKMCLAPRGTARPWHPESTVLDVAAMQRVSDTEFLWDAGTLTVGWYRIGFWGVDYWTKLEIGPADNMDHHIVVPGPGEVIVRVVDASTEQPILNGSLHWYVPLPDDCEGTICGWSSEVRPLADGTFRFVAPPSRVSVGLSCDADHRELRQSIEVKPGSNEFTLRTRRVFGIDVTLQSDGRTVPWGLTTTRLLDESNRLVMARERSRIRPDSPGRYWLVLDNLRGFEADPVLVDVPETGFAPVTVHLRRR